MTDVSAATGPKVKKRIEFTFGPAFFAIMGQIVLGGIAVTYGYGQLVSTSDNTRKLTEQLQHIIEKQDSRTNGISDRLIAVETKVSGIADSVRNLDLKFDRMRPQQP